MCSTCAPDPSQTVPAATGPSAPGLLDGRTVLVTGVLRPSSIATAVTAVALSQGARVVLTGLPRTLAATRALSRRLGVTDPVIPLDVADPGSLASLGEDLRGCGVEHLDGVVHCLAHADTSLLGSLLDRDGPGAGRGTWEDTSRVPAQDSSQRPGEQGVSPGTGGTARPRREAAPGAAGWWQRPAALESAFTVSVASLPALVGAVLPLLGTGSAVVALTFDSERVHPGYGWMGPLKAALEASVRGLAAQLGGGGVRVNALSAGPLRTPAASAVPGLEDMIDRWKHAAPLGWDPHDAGPVARGVVALLSGWLPVTTGQVVYADGGAWLTGA